jgi:phosphoesterase RecJ-like protein
MPVCFRVSQVIKHKLARPCVFGDWGVLCPAMADQYQAILDILGRAKRVLVTTHVRPDGDALGTAAAMVLGMRAKGIDAHVLLLSHLPKKYEFVFKELGVDHTDVEHEWPATLSLEAFDTFLVVDTGTWSQLPGLRERIANWRVPKLVVDHHLTQEDWADAKLVVTEAAAAGEIAAELLEQWDVELTEPIAKALFLAIASDTGWFQFSNTRPFTFRLAAMLIEAGVNTDQLYQLLYQNERAERVALQTRAQQSLELLCDQRLAVMRVSKGDFETSRANVGDTENLINIPLQIRAVEVSLLFTEPMDGGAIRVSLRSKGGVDVARFAEQFGGGGHARAAGLKVNGSLQAVHDQVVGAMVAKLETVKVER